MKSKVLFAVLLFMVSCANGKDRNFTGSTPAATVVREFLGIDFRDSIDFIRWKLVLNDLHFKLECNYGIGKPNTNGFINGGERYWKQICECNIKGSGSATSRSDCGPACS